MQEHRQRWWAKPTYYHKFIPDTSNNKTISDDINIIPLDMAQSCVNGVLAMDINNRPCCTTQESCKPLMYQSERMDTYNLYG